MTRYQIVQATLAVRSLAVFMIGCVFARSSEDPEATVCGWFRERAAFASWSHSAGVSDDTLWHSIPGAAPITYATRDGRTLRGYRLSASGDTTRKGFVLVAQGNAMLAHHLLRDLSGFAGEGLDAFVYDYRGYGNSEGRPRLKAIVSDYREIFATLSRPESGRKVLYGISFGGIVLSNVIGSGEQYDPVVNLAADARRLMIISGTKDTVITPSEMRELVVTAQARGARTVVSDQIGRAS